MLKAYNDGVGKGGKKRKVVSREAVAVLSQGTLTEPCMLTASPQATFVAAVVEVPLGGEEGRVRVGVCAVDAAAGRVLIGDFDDGPLRATLQRCCSGARRRPVSY